MYPIERPTDPPVPDMAASARAVEAGRASSAGVKVRRVLLATDLTNASEVATDWAFALAEQHAADLLVVSVIDPRELRQDLPGSGPRWDQIRDRRHAAAQELVTRGRPGGLNVSVLVWTGDPGQSIVSAAESEGADLIVVGTHGRGTIGRLLLGSVSEYLVRHAPCPVLVARPGTGLPQGAPRSTR
jgi:universal stress protein A